MLASQSGCDAIDRKRDSLPVKVQKSISSRLQWAEAFCSYSYRNKYSNGATLTIDGLKPTSRYEQESSGILSIFGGGNSNKKSSCTLAITITLGVGILCGFFLGHKVSRS